MQTLLYARYSSHLQNPRSIADQLAALRARCQAEGWTIAAEFSDAAISGAAGIDDHQRPGLAALLARIEAGGIQQVFTESTDRIARHQGDAFMVRERIEHAGARLFTLMDGHVDDITGTIKGLMDARQRKDLAERVRRGHRGNVTSGRAASGVAFGYRKVSRFDEKGEAIRGLREPDPVTALIVLRAFEEYAAGRSTLDICKAFNAEGIPAPRGGIWRPTTLIGHRNAGFGLLANPIYIGQLVYGRSRAVTDPRTRRKQMRPGAAEPATGSAPHLRIVPDDLWRAVQHQLAERSGGPAHRQRRPRHLLSGLGVCGTCGQTWVKVRDDYFGCGGVAHGGACTNRRTIQQDEYERRVLAELTGQMLAPEAVAAYLDEYRAEHARRTREAGSERTRLERAKADAERRIANLVAAIADGGDFPELRTALAGARAARDAADKGLTALAALPTVALHPGLARQYRAAIANLAEELRDGATRAEAAPKIRQLIARIEVHPRGLKRRAGVDIVVTRHIDEILTLAQATA